MIDVYDYLAHSNPNLAKQIIENFGYQCTDSNMAQNLRQLVAKEGEPALVLIMNNHPDKDIILEMFPPEVEIKECSQCKERQIIDKYINMNGEKTTPAKMVENNFSIIFLAGIMILTVAILKK